VNQLTIQDLAALDKAIASPPVPQVIVSAADEIAERAVTKMLLAYRDELTTECDCGTARKLVTVAQLAYTLALGTLQDGEDMRRAMRQTAVALAAIIESRF